MAVQKIVIEPDYAGQRLDNYIFARFRKVPKSAIYKLLRKGQFRVNSGRVKANYKLNSGDIVRVPPIKAVEETPTNTVVNLESYKKTLNKLQNSILYEDKDVVVFNKPSGLAVHGGSGLNFGLIELVPELGIKGKHFELAHRIDKETSGCLIVAKKRSVLKDLHQQFRDNTITKQYLCLVKGRLSENREVKAPLLRQIGKGGERLVTVHPDGKAASTFFKTIKQLDDATLIMAEPKTGRTHQIRVHCAHVGNPIAGDAKYGCQEFDNKIGINRLFLHAYTVSFMVNGRNIVVKADLPPELSKFVD